MIVKISCRHAQILHYLMFNSKPSLLDIRLLVVSCKDKQVRVGSCARRRRGQDVWISQPSRNYSCRIERDAGDVDAVLRMDRADHDRRSAAIVNTEAAAYRCFFVRRITEARAWREVVFVFRTNAGIDAVG